MRALDAHGLPLPEGGGAALLRSSELARRRGTAAVDGGDHGHDATARERGGGEGHEDRRLTTDAMVRLGRPEEVGLDGIEHGDRRPALGKKGRFGRLRASQHARLEGEGGEAEAELMAASNRAGASSVGGDSRRPTARVSSRGEEQRGRGIGRGEGEVESEGERRSRARRPGGLILAGRKAGGGKAPAAVELVHGQKEKEEENKRKHVLQKTPWVFRKLVREVKQLQKL